MTNTNRASGGSKEKLLKTSKQGTVELSEGQPSVASGKAKTADKAFNAMDAYIRG